MYKINIRYIYGEPSPPDTKLDPIVIRDPLLRLVAFLPYPIRHVVAQFVMTRPLYLIMNRYKVSISECSAHYGDRLILRTAIKNLDIMPAHSRRQIMFACEDNDNHVPIRLFELGDVDNVRLMLNRFNQCLPTHSMRIAREQKNIPMIKLIYSIINQPDNANSLLIAAYAGLFQFIRDHTSRMRAHCAIHGNIRGSFGGRHAYNGKGIEYALGMTKDTRIFDIVADQVAVSHPIIRWMKDNKFPTSGHAIATALLRGDIKSADLLLAYTPIALDNGHIISRVLHTDHPSKFEILEWILQRIPHGSYCVPLADLLTHGTPEIINLIARYRKLEFPYECRDKVKFDNLRAFVNHGVCLRPSSITGLTRMCDQETIAWIIDNMERTEEYYMVHADATHTAHVCMAQVVAKYCGPTIIQQFIDRGENFTAHHVIDAAHNGNSDGAMFLIRRFLSAKSPWLQLPSNIICGALRICEDVKKLTNEIIFQYIITREPKARQKYLSIGERQITDDHDSQLSVGNSNMLDFRIAIGLGLTPTKANFVSAIRVGKFEIADFLLRIGIFVPHALRDVLGERIDCGCIYHCSCKSSKIIDCCQQVRWLFERGIITREDKDDVVESTAWHARDYVKNMSMWK